MNFYQVIFNSYITIHMIPYNFHGSGRHCINQVKLKSYARKEKLEKSQNYIFKKQIYFISIKKT